MKTIQFESGLIISLEDIRKIAKIGDYQIVFCYTDNREIVLNTNTPDTHLEQIGNELGSKKILNP